MEIADLILGYIRVLIWPIFTFSLCILFRSELKALFRRIHHVELPGGGSLDLQQEIREVRVLSEKVAAVPPPPDKKHIPTIPLTEANARMIQVGLRPSPSGLDMTYYRSLAQQDPNVALAGLRIEIDILARNLAQGFKVQINETDSGNRLLRKLHDKHAITTDQFQLGIKVMALCNAAAHGSQVSYGQALEVIDVAEVLSDQYAAWLSWGFGADWEPRNQ